jgi:prolipoprotein diacylglyceryltransferase
MWGEGTSVLATQLIESLFGFALFGALTLLDRRRPRDGALILVAAMSYGSFRFILDFYRYYESSMQIALGPARALSVNQLVSLALVVACAVALARRPARGRGVGVESDDPGIVSVR